MLDKYSFNVFKKKYKGDWKYKCKYCEKIISVPKEPTGGYYTWDYCDSVVNEYVTKMLCSEQCAKEVEQLYRKRRGLA